MAVESYTIGVLEGDGIGPEIVPVAVEVMQAAAGAAGLSLSFERLPVGLSAYGRTGTTLPEETIEALERLGLWILGPTSTHQYDPGTMRNPSGVLRRRFDLYANIRPATSWPGIRALRSDIDLVIVRENTEGFYADRNVLDGTGEFRPNEDTVISLRVTNRRACRRIAEVAFALAVQRNRKRRVTAVHKASILRHGCGMFLDECRSVWGAYPDVRFDDCLVDACAMRLARDPQEFDVIVTTNMFGDILSDEAAALVGGLGLAPSLNAGERHAMAQASHGSAPDIAGRGIANPCALILSTGLLLEWVARRDESEAALAAGATIRRAVAAALTAGRDLTPDLGGQGNTRALGAAILAHLDAP